MSVQEEYLLEIANAIREKDGTTDSIQAKTYPERIRNIKTNTGTRSKFGRGISQISAVELLLCGGWNPLYERAYNSGGMQ